MLELTAFDSFKDDLQKLDVKTVQFLIEELERNEIDTETKYLFLTIVLQQRNIGVFRVLLDKFQAWFLAEKTREEMSLRFIEQILEKTWSVSLSERFEFIELLISKKIIPRLFLKVAVQQACYDPEIFAKLYQAILSKCEPKYYFIALFTALNVDNNAAVEVILNNTPGSLSTKVCSFLLRFKDLKKYSWPTQIAVVCFSARYQYCEDFIVYWDQLGGSSEEDTLKVIKACTKLSKEDFENKLRVILQGHKSGYSFLDYLALVIDEIPKEWLIELLSRYKYHLNQQNSLGKTFLHLLCERCDAAHSAYYLALIDLALGLDAKPNIFDNTGSSLLHIAVYKKNLGLMQLLIKHQANPSLKHGVFSSSPMDIANHEKEPMRSQMLAILIKTTVKNATTNKSKRKRSTSKATPNSEGISTYRNVIDLTKSTRRTFDKKICPERHPHSVRDQLLQAIRKNAGENFKQIMPVKVDSLSVDLFKVLLLEIIYWGRYEMLVLVLNTVGNDYLAKNETLLILRRAIENQNMNLQIIEALLKSGAKAYINSSLVKCLVAAKGNRELTQLIEKYTADMEVESSSQVEKQNILSLS